MARRVRIPKTKSLKLKVKMPKFKVPKVITSLNLPKTLKLKAPKVRIRRRS